MFYFNFYDIVYSTSNQIPSPRSLILVLSRVSGNIWCLILHTLDINMIDDVFDATAGFTRFRLLDIYCLLMTKFYLILRFFVFCPLSVFVVDKVFVKDFIFWGCFILFNSPFILVTYSDFRIDLLYSPLANSVR